jgi:hypothetical protein
MAVAAASAMVFGSSAFGADKATGWHNWADKAELIVAATKSGDRPRVDAACMGVTKVVVSQGFAFPRWAQVMPNFCGRYQEETTKRVITMQFWREECKQLRGTRNEISKAVDVPEEPRAKPLADQMTAMLTELEVRECSHRPERAN